MFTGTPDDLWSAVAWWRAVARMSAAFHDSRCAVFDELEPRAGRIAWLESVAVEVSRKRSNHLSASLQCSANKLLRLFSVTGCAYVGSSTSAFLCCFPPALLSLLCRCRELQLLGRNPLQPVPALRWTWTSERARSLGVAATSRRRTCCTARLSAEAWKSTLWCLPGGLRAAKHRQATRPRWWLRHFWIFRQPMSLRISLNRTVCSAISVPSPC
jgi:hypothetical protein